ncbi:uncharacterized protein LOC110831526 isoform X2 [Zootermopsis nevadensis]|uniref:uncharacterized protein LOC110831526 isoform X2 n=1 Tax=Zootermopsis nevadensis TaxID=136037 RepID=UPI000B8E293C|nr:uncharacterized protein LOC110831526 isoform X2 [Zootermopsis nevadensis]
MLKFLTNKFRTHSLNEDQLQQDKGDEDHDSGTESDDELCETEDQESIMESETERSSGSTLSPSPFAGIDVIPYSPSSPFLDSALPSDSDHNNDHHSSEEELEVINNPSKCAAFGSSLKELLTCRSGSVNAVVPEKRKWSQVTSSSACSLSNTNHLSTNSSDLLTISSGSCSSLHGGNGSNVAALAGAGGRASVAVVTTTPAADHSSGSSDEEIQGLLAAMATPVKFRTTPPLDVHKPGLSLSPPPKLFHFGTQSSAAAALEVSPRKRHRHTPRAHHIQRPCLDFEKMQLLKARSVTAWRHGGDHGGELSVYCW